jgi:RimJ/RimL family protein N-acetyltransferase/N-acetylglutamate synthase-like GNAT family acetyltransferase
VIRAFRDEDAPRVVELLRRLETFWPVTEESVLFDGVRQPPIAGRRVWVADGGYALARRLWESKPEGAGSLWVGVAPERRGLGTELLRRAADHLRVLGVERARTWAEAEGAAFLERRGWQRARERVISAVDAPPAAIDPPQGIELAPLRAVDPRALFELDALCNEPGETIEFGSFEDYKRNELERPLLDLDGSFAAVVNGRPVAISIIFRHESVAHNGFTCTHPDWRGRGLATLAKTATLRHAFEQGVERIATMNDAENPAMLRVNERLGYRPIRTEHQLQLPLTERTSGVSPNQSTTLTEQ